MAVATGRTQSMHGEKGRCVEKPDLENRGVKKKTRNYRNVSNLCKRMNHGI
jgi:hypothetical protein